MFKNNVLGCPHYRFHQLKYEFQHNNNKFTEHFKPKLAPPSKRLERRKGAPNP